MSLRSLRPRPPLVAHVVEYFATGGLENGLVNLINHMPPGAYRHAVVCLKGHSPFRNRLTRDDVEVIDLRKRPGMDLMWYADLWSVLRRLRPAIVHTRNLGTLEAQAVAFAAGVDGRVHGEHGRDVLDLDGTNPKHRLLRRVLDPCVGRYIAVNADLERWLIDVVGVPGRKVTAIYNGVDTARFRPRLGSERPGPAPAGAFVIGTVGRMAAVKDQTMLVRAFLHLLRGDGSLRHRLRLVLVGEGPLRRECEALLEAEGAADLCWMPGDRDDIPDILRSIDLFVLPSLAEGTSNTILEAMASGLPVVAFDVGGNRDLVIPGVTGTLVPARNHVTLAAALRSYIDQPLRAEQHGARARQRVVSNFGLSGMVDAYVGVYDAASRSQQRSRSVERRAAPGAAM